MSDDYERDYNASLQAMRRLNPSLGNEPKTMPNKASLAEALNYLRKHEEHDLANAVSAALADIEGAGKDEPVAYRWRNKPSQDQEWNYSAHGDLSRLSPLRRDLVEVEPLYLAPSSPAPVGDIANLIARLLQYPCPRPIDHDKAVDCVKAGQCGCCEKDVVQAAEALSRMEEREKEMREAIDEIADFQATEPWRLTAKTMQDIARRARNLLAGKEEGK